MKKSRIFALLFIAVVFGCQAFAQNGGLTRMMPDSATMRKEWLKTIDRTTQDLSLSYNHNSMGSIMVERADAEANLKRYSKAIDDYNKAIFFNPALKMIYKRRAMVYERAGNYRAAIIDYEKALEGMKADKLNSAIIWNFIAGNQYQLGNFAKSVKADSTAIGLWPQFAMAYANKGWSNMQLGKFRQAADDFTESLKGFQNSPLELAAVYRNRGEAYAAQQKYTEAISDYKTALQYTPDLRDCYWGLAVAYSAINENLLAIANYNKALSSFKGDNKSLSKIYVDRAEMESRQHQFDKAIEDDSLAVVSDGANFNAYSALGNAHAMNGNLQQSNYWYTRALEYFKNDPESVKILSALMAGQCYFMGQYDKAVELSNTALSVDKSFCGAYFNRGRAYLKKASNDLAMADFNKVLSLESTKREPTYIFALFYTGKTEQAVSTLKDNLAGNLDRRTAGSFYFYLACLYSIMNKANEANEVFKRAVEIGFPPKYAACSPDLDNIRNTPEFRNIVGMR